MLIFNFSSCLRSKATYLQEYNNEGANRLDKTELQRCLLAEAQESDGVGGATEAACPVDARRAHGPPAQLRHYVALAAQVLIAQGQETVDHECWK